MKYQWKFDGNVATFIALQTMWQTPPSTDRHEPMEGCFTSLQPRPFSAKQKEPLSTSFECLPSLCGVRNLFVISLHWGCVVIADDFLFMPLDVAPSKAFWFSSWIWQSIPKLQPKFPSFDRPLNEPSKHFAEYFWVAIHLSSTQSFLNRRSDACAINSREDPRSRTIYCFLPITLTTSATFHE